MGQMVQEAQEAQVAQVVRRALEDQGVQGKLVEVEKAEGLASEAVRIQAFCIITRSTANPATGIEAVPPMRIGGKEVCLIPVIDGVSHLAGVPPPIAVIIDGEKVEVYPTIKKEGRDSCDYEFMATGEATGPPPPPPPPPGKGAKRRSPAAGSAEGSSQNQGAAGPGNGQGGGPGNGAGMANGWPRLEVVSIGKTSFCALTPIDGKCISASGWENLGSKSSEVFE